MRIPIAHDFVCEWCWIGLFQTRRLRQEFGIQFDWLGYELYPAGLIEKSVVADPPPPPNRPLTPSRLTLAFAAAGIAPVRAKKPMPETIRAHQAVEFAKQFGDPTSLVERIYIAFWQENRDISDLDVLLSCAKGLVPNLEELRSSIESHQFEERIVRFDDSAYATGIYNLPTFWIGNQRLAEQPYERIRDAIIREVGCAHLGETPYPVLEFPINSAPKDRPYVFINMVSTVDGKIITGKRGEPVQDLGSKTDHIAMREIQSVADGVLIGANSQRSSDLITYPESLLRFVVSRSGNLLFESRFFRDDPKKVIVLQPAGASFEVPEGVRILTFETFVDAAKRMKEDFGVQRLLIEGGSDLNAQWIAAGLVDELFLTLAPKVKLGKDTPTYADGTALERNEVKSLALISEKRIGDELFLRYRFTAGTPTT